MKREEKIREAGKVFAQTMARAEMAFFVAKDSAYMAFVKARDEAKDDE